MYDQERTREKGVEPAREIIIVTDGALRKSPMVTRLAEIPNLGFHPFQSNRLC